MMFFYSEGRSNRAKKNSMTYESLISLEVIKEDQMIQNWIPDAKIVKEASLVLNREAKVQESGEICQVERDLQWQEQEEEKWQLNQQVILEEDEKSVEILNLEKDENENKVKLLQENNCVLKEYEVELAIEDEVKEVIFDAIEESRSYLSCSSVV